MTLCSGNGQLSYTIVTSSGCTLLLPTASHIQGRQLLETHLSPCTAESITSSEAISNVDSAMTDPSLADDPEMLLGLLGDGKLGSFHTR